MSSDALNANLSHYVWCCVEVDFIGYNHGCDQECKCTTYHYLFCISGNIRDNISKPTITSDGTIACIMYAVKLLHCRYRVRF